MQKVTATWTVQGPRSKKGPAEIPRVLRLVKLFDQNLAPCGTWWTQGFFDSNIQLRIHLLLQAAQPHSQEWTLEQRFGLKKWSNYEKRYHNEDHSSFSLANPWSLHLAWFPKGVMSLPAAAVTAPAKSTQRNNTPNFFKSTLKLPKSRNSFTMDQRPNLTHLIYLMYLLKELLASK